MLMAPMRGSPPPAPEGYEPSPGNPFVFLPCMEECEHRGIKKPKNYCCGRGDRLFCAVIENVVLRITCSQCKSNPEWIKKNGT